eukprot:COSAG01_NODE_61049_length_291_cov_1.067708_2_plen_35_part_01
MARWWRLSQHVMCALLLAYRADVQADIGAQVVADT